MSDEVTLPDQPRQGPSGYENWQAANAGRPPLRLFEVQLYSDGRILGAYVSPQRAPYGFLNMVPLRDGEFIEAVALRVAWHMEMTVPDMTKTDTTRYHGGWLADELSALCGLLLGIRLRPGGISRDFYAGDDLGHPRADFQRPPAPLPTRYGSPLIPRAFEPQDIHTALSPLFASYPRLSRSEAISLVRSARLYQDALWIAEAQPALSWLLFVSALEVVAVHHQDSSLSREQILKSWKPKLYADLEKTGDPTVISKVAKHLERSLDSQKRLLAFLQAFRPGPPPRPNGAYRPISWEWVDLESALRKIYEYRSRALHDGTPFPEPMCHPEFQAGLHLEKPDAIATATNEAAWRSDDLPMLLHVFEHIARNTIVNWWRSLDREGALVPGSA